jgi:hypothetical protein
MKWILVFVVSFGALAQNQRMRDSFKNLTKIESPFELRDPFRPPLIKTAKEDNSGQETSYRDGIFTNISAVGDIDIKTLKIVGVLVGRDRRAMAKANGKEDVLVLREGMKIGADQAELKAILPGGVILVEKIVNVYGEEEYLETVIPISR